MSAGKRGSGRKGRRPCLSHKVILLPLQCMFFVRGLQSGKEAGHYFTSMPFFIFVTFVSFLQNINQFTKARSLKFFLLLSARVIARSILLVLARW